jgi:hypothetical protein
MSDSDIHQPPNVLVSRITVARNVLSAPNLSTHPPPSLSSDITVRRNTLEAPRYAALNAYQLAVIGADGVPPFEGTLAEWLESLNGTADFSKLWINLVSSWTEEPTLNAEPPVLGGSVYDYVFGLTTRYRHIPDPYDPTLDAFYEEYAAGVLNVLVATKGLAI